MILVQKVSTLPFFFLRLNVIAEPIHKSGVVFPNLRPKSRLTQRSGGKGRREKQKGRGKPVLCGGSTGLDKLKHSHTGARGPAGAEELWLAHSFSLHFLSLMQVKILRFASKIITSHTQKEKSERTGWFLQEIVQFSFRLLV